MVGRKRKKVAREPNGRAQRERGIEPNAIAQLMPHRRLVPAELAHDPKAECIMGRLCLNGWLTEAQYQAGVKYRAIVLRYRAVIEAPRSTEASMAGVIVGPWGGSSMTEERAIEIRNEYMRAFEALEGAGGTRDVAHLIHDRTQFVLARAKCGLTGLAEYYGLTKPEKNASHK